MRLFDCFIFFNETDLLEFRLKLLDPYVDFFVLTESNVTYSGKSKPYYFEENRGRYEKWLHKIIYIRAWQDAEGMVFDKPESSYNPASDAWKLENGLRNFLAQAGTRINVLQKTKNLQQPHALSLLFHYYFLNCQHTGYERWWKGSIICSGKQFKESPPQHFRDNRHVYPAIPKAGWHFSYLGGLEKIRYKILSFAHTEFAREEFYRDANILSAMEKGIDLFRRPGVRYRFVSVYYYPAWLRSLMLQYPHLLHLKNENNPFMRFYYTIKNIINPG
jgi:beta-1,4-mannosyl-glycoprotein beta-1,4-N-acetylglucosaminyltransferase